MAELSVSLTRQARILRLKLSMTACQIDSDAVSCSRITGRVMPMSRWTNGGSTGRLRSPHESPGRKRACARGLFDPKTEKAIKPSTRACGSFLRNGSPTTCSAAVLRRSEELAKKAAARKAHKKGNREFCSRRFRCWRSQLSELDSKSLTRQETLSSRPAGWDVDFGQHIGSILKIPMSEDEVGAIFRRLQGSGIIAIATERLPIVPINDAAPETPEGKRSSNTNSTRPCPAEKANVARVAALQ